MTWFDRIYQLPTDIKNTPLNNWLEADFLFECHVYSCVWKVNVTEHVEGLGKRAKGFNQTVGAVGNNDGHFLYVLAFYRLNN